jgi:predicted house-cleaning noncanonical NTP pyrophosphatase (MazG superfamily)
MKRYNKIIRDNIPEIIQQSGKQYTIETVEDKDAVKYLIDKLFEEATELKNKFSIEEIADLQEVLDAIIDKSGVEKSELATIKRDKHKERGGFNKNIILKIVK